MTALRLQSPKHAEQKMRPWIKLNSQSQWCRLNEELRSNDWVKVADQPPMRIMKISRKGKCIQELVE